MKNAFRDVCEACFREEERQYDLVYNFIRKRENRTATMLQVTKATGVPETLIYKFIKHKRLQVSQFPNLGYPCDQCGELIQKGKLCETCQTSFNQQVNKLKEAENRKAEDLKNQQMRTYHTFDNKDRK